MQLISKALSERIKNVLPCIIYKSQTTYVSKRIISEGGRLMDDFLEICNMFNKEGFLVTISIGKTLNTVSHNFLITILEKFGFGNTFIQWIKILLKDQESCIAWQVNILN